MAGKKQVFEGWVGAGVDVVSVAGWVNYYGVRRLVLTNIRPNRGWKKHWHPADWPPHKVRITVEEV